MLWARVELESRVAEALGDQQAGQRTGEGQGEGLSTGLGG